MSRRRKGKGGRPRRVGVERRKNGKISEKRAVRNQIDAMTEAEAMSVAIDARVRHTGLSPELAGANVLNGPNAGTVHGVLALRGDLSRDEFDAAEWYLGWRQAWLRAIRAPGHYVEVDPERPRSDDPEAEADWAKAVVDLWNDIRRVLQETCTQLRRPADAALTVILVKQQPMPEMLPDLQACLRVIHRRFMAGERQAA